MFGNLIMSIRYSNEQKVLVVDDEKPICDMLRLALTRAGYSVFIATSSKQALKIMKSERCRVMFVDYNLPEISGLNLYKAIKFEYPDSVAYLMTGWASEEDLFACHAAGFKGWFTKPISLQVFIKAAQDAFADI